MQDQNNQNPIPEPVQPVNQTPVKPVKVNNFLVLPLSVLLLITVVIAGLFAYQNFKLKQQITQDKSSLIPSPSPTPALPTPAAENEVLGFQTTICCSCPTKISPFLIGTNGWVIYEIGKDYSDFRPKTCQNIACQPCPPLEENQTKIDCKDPRPEVCTMECIQNPPYICGSDGKSYCTVCQVCANKDVAWYEMKASACEEFAN